MDFGLQDKTALVLGGGGGLGSAIAHTLASEGARIAIGDIDPASVDRVVEEVKAKEVPALGVVWDLSDLTCIDEHVSIIEKKLGLVDVLVNITGGPPPTPAAGQSPDLWTKNFQGMVLSVIAVTDRVLPYMKARHWGRVITKFHAKTSRSSKDSKSVAAAGESSGNDVRGINMNIPSNPKMVDSCSIKGR